MKFKNSQYFLFLFVLCGLSCKKSIENIQRSVLEKYFDENLIGKNFVVSLAKIGTDDFTAEYSGYTFVLLKTDFYHGPLKATYGSNVYMGTWSSNDDYGKLTISLPDSVEPFKFLSRSWRFIKKDVPTLQLAPWGSTDPIFLNMTRQ